MKVTLEFLNFKFIRDNFLGFDPNYNYLQLFEVSSFILNNNTFDNKLNIISLINQLDSCMFKITYDSTIYEEKVIRDVFFDYEQKKFKYYLSYNFKYYLAILDYLKDLTGIDGHINKIEFNINKTLMDYMLENKLNPINIDGYIIKKLNTLDSNLNENNILSELKNSICKIHFGNNFKTVNLIDDFSLNVKDNILLVKKSSKCYDYLRICKRLLKIIN